MKNQYMTYQESLDFLSAMERKHPDLIEIVTIGTTYEGREIVLAKISRDVASADEKPALLYTGSIHAREWIGQELALKFIDHITRNQHVDPTLDAALETSTLYMVPCLNPDGFEYSRKHFSFWRKNRRKNHDGTIGVDLNRNFSIGFKKVNDTASNVYGGEEPFSEAETRAIRDFVNNHPNITIALDYHSQGNVFFPAHRFMHEAEIDGTDMNVIAANMNDAIAKVTGRKYGIHRGKPPAGLISGSGREYYYSQGIKALVVEVGTKNIPDYMKSMSSSIHENIPALIRTFSEVVNYAPTAPKRVENFTVAGTDARSVHLTWDYEVREDIYFEIYRSTHDKDACNERTRIGIAGEHRFVDTDLSSATNYHYTLRAVNKTTGLKSPFAPIVKVRTGLKEDEFFRFLHATKGGTGYVAQYTQEQNRSHFGLNSLFVGVNQSKGISDAVVSFDLSTLPEDAIIKSARFYLYPMNRVGAKIEKYGEWNLSLLEADSFTEITDFEAIENARPKVTVGRAIRSSQLTQGIWNDWEFSSHECAMLQEEIAHGTAVFRVDGPKSLPEGEDSQMMQFDIGYGQYGGGIHYRPMLDVTYTVPRDRVDLPPCTLATVSIAGTEEGLRSGFDVQGDRVYGYLEFDTAQLPDPSQTVITECALKIRNTNHFKKASDVRFYVELVEMDEVGGYEDIRHREKIEYLGYEVAEKELSTRRHQYFKFDTLSKKILDALHQNGAKLKLVIKPTSALGARNRVTQWNNDVELVVRYIPRRRQPPAPVERLTLSKENKMIKLTWSGVEDDALKGYYVVRNSFHPPRHFMDGVKIYGGRDTWTYDNFASFSKPKYYAVFTYDDVPNFSAPTLAHYDPLETY